MLVLAGAAALWCAAPLAGTAEAAAVTVAGTWGKAIEVPGTGALNKGGDAIVNSVSCASAGNCAVGGHYMDRSGHLQAFEASERNGTWRTAIEVPGTAALNKGGIATVVSVSCASAGNCAAGGDYTDRSRNEQAFVATERNGTWRTAIEVPGTGALNKGGNANVSSVSCASAGDCAVGGSYMDRSGHLQAFVASERNGTWRTAIEVPGTGAHPERAGGGASVSSVSCASPGNCAAGGSYTDRSGHGQAFVASERNGTWRTAIEVPGTGALNKGRLPFFPAVASVLSVSCASAGNCTAGGYYRDRSGLEQAFVASERNGTWRTAIEVPGTGALNKGGPAPAGAGAAVLSVSCASAGNCVAGGSYEVNPCCYLQQAFVASERDGTWRTAIEVPGIAALNKGLYANVLSVSCASAGNCAAGGEYADSSHHAHAFVASERDGTWRTAIEVPGTAALNKGLYASVNSVSCAPAGNCTAGGYYANRRGKRQAFVASQT